MRLIYERCRSADISGKRSKPSQAWAVARVGVDVLQAREGMVVE